MCADNSIGTKQKKQIWQKKGKIMRHVSLSPVTCNLSGMPTATILPLLAPHYAYWAGL